MGLLPRLAGAAVRGGSAGVVCLALMSLTGTITAPLQVAATSPAASSSPAPSPPLTVTAPNWPPAVDGQTFAAVVHVTGTVLRGCFRIVANGLPPGLGVLPSTICNDAGAAEVTTQVLGKPSLAPLYPLQTREVTINAYRLGSAGASVAAGQVPNGTATATLYLAPPAANPKVGLSYAGTALQGVSCAGSSCWTFGYSNNPPGPAGLTATGHASQQVKILDQASGKQVSVIAGGYFVARIVKQSPLDLDIVRGGMKDRPLAVACGSQDACVFAGTNGADYAGGQAARVLIMQQRGKTWMEVTPALPNVAVSQASTVACQQFSICVLGGFIATPAGIRTGFTAQLVPSQGAAGMRAPVILGGVASEVGAVSCPSASLCFIGGTRWAPGGATANVKILVSHDGGGSWAPDQLVALNPGEEAGRPPTLQPYFDLLQDEVTFGGVSSMGCAPGSTDCAVAWGGWPAIANTTDGIHWVPGTLTQAPYSLSKTIGDPVSCPSAGRCFVVSNPIPICGSNVCPVVGILESIPGGPGGWKWGLVGYGPPGTKSPHLNGISCTGISSCVAVGTWEPYEGTPWSPPFPLVMAPQSPQAPYYVPPANPLKDFLSNPATWAFAFAAMATILAPAFPLFAFALGAASFGLGLPKCLSGNLLACGGSLIGFGGLWTGTLGLISTAASLPGLGAGKSADELPPWLQQAMHDNWAYEARTEGALV